MCLRIKNKAVRAKQPVINSTAKRLRTFKSRFITTHQNPSCLSDFSAAGQAEGRRAARTFPGGCWVKREQEEEEGHQRLSNGETSHSAFTFSGFGCLHGLQILVLLVEHPQVLRAAGLQNMSSDVGRHVWEGVRRQRDESVVRDTNLEGRLADQALVDYRPYAPQVGLGVVILRHDDLWGLRGAKGAGEDGGEGVI